jgi:hypothetical protein
MHNVRDPDAGPDDVHMSTAGVLMCTMGSVRVGFRTLRMPGGGVRERPGTLSPAPNPARAKARAAASIPLSDRSPRTDKPGEQPADLMLAVPILTTGSPAPNARSSSSSSAPRARGPLEPVL